MWKIHGKYYDLTNFLDKHPGGSKILESCKGVDCTAAFESYHALSNMNNIKSIMKKYEIDTSKSETIQSFKQHSYTFSEKGFYNEVKNRVRNYILTDYYTINYSINYSINYKWTWSWLVYASLTFVTYIYSYIQTFIYINNPFYLRCCYCIICSTSLIQGLFQIYHDATHFAVSKNKYVNEYLAIIGSGLAFWDYTTWSKHHSILHHSFTGDYVNDPDMKHTHPFIKKSLKNKKEKHKLIKNTYPISFIISIFPGMYFGQVTSYIIVQFRKRLWGFQIYKTKTYTEIIIILMQLCIMIYGRSILLVMLYFLSLNINYSVAILPDHDLYETNQNQKEDATDWGEIQVRHSGNFANKNWLYTRLYGGINYQIEHHLFPSICSYHLPAIAHIVKIVCKEYDIKYVCSPTIWNAYWSAIKNLVIINK